MKFVVCLKPIKESLVSLDPQTSESYLLNPYDLFTLAELKKIKKGKKAQVTGLMMGSEKADKIIHRALGMGLDDFVLITDPKIGGADTYATSFVLSQGLKSIGDVDYICCGKKALDGETGQVPGALSERLSLPIYTNILTIEEIWEDGLVCTCDFEGTIYRQVIEKKAVLVFSDFLINEPSISLSALKRAKKKEFTKWNLEDIDVNPDFRGLKDSKTKILEIDHDQEETRVPAQVEGNMEDKFHYIMQAVTDWD